MRPTRTIAALTYPALNSLGAVGEGSGLVLVLHLPVDVGPELLHQVRQTIPHVELAQGAQIAAEGAVFWGVVDVGDARR